MTTWRLDRHRLRGVLVGAALFGVAAWWGARYVSLSRAAGREAFFYQSYFEPAALMACGRGFVVAAPPRPRALDDFLLQKSDRLQCADLPADLAVKTDDLFQYAWFYLMIAVGVAWRVLGVSWSGLSPLFGVLFATVIVLAYALFRLAVPRVFAAACAVALILSPLHLLNLPLLRDYAKAPFVLALVLILWWLVSRPLRTGAVVALAAAYGVILGIGYGFRTDLLANVPPLPVTLALFLPGGVTRNLGVKAAALAAAAAAFAIAARPVTTYVTKNGGCQWHVALLGLDADYNDELGVTSSFYQWTSTYSDEFIYTTVSSYRNRMRGPAPMEYCSHEYDIASGAYLRDIVTTVPGDMVTRAYASAWRVFDLPFAWVKEPLPGVAPVYGVREAIVGRLAGAGRAAVLLAMVMIGAQSLRLGLFALCFVLYFGGYPALQFANRHYFHLEFIGWWAMAFVAYRAAVLVRAGERGEWARWQSNALRFGAIAASIVVLPLLVFRGYQDHQLARLIDTLERVPRENVPMSPAADGRGIRLAATLDATTYDPTQTAYLDVHFDLQKCPNGVPLDVRYDQANPPFNFSKPLRVAPPATIPARVLLPVFRYFQGFDLGGAPEVCISSIERLSYVRKLALLPVLTLPADWRHMPFHQTLSAAAASAHP